MAVVGSAQEMKDTGDFQFEVGSYNVRRRFRVITNDVEDDYAIVTAAPGIPALFSTYVSPKSSNRYLRARKYEARRLLPGSVVWTVTVVYETAPVKTGTGSSDSTGGPGGGSGGGTPEEKDEQFKNPILELPDVEMTASDREELLTQIYDTSTGNLKPVTASSGEPFDPPPKTLIKVLMLKIERNEPLSTPHPALAVTYMNAVNADPFWGLAPGTWLCKKVTAKRATRQLADGTTGVYLRVTYEFEARSTWDLYVLDSGRYYLGPRAADAGSNVYFPFGPGCNPWLAFFLPNAAPAGLTSFSTQFQRKQFISAEGHPIRAALNGQGGPLPEMSTFTASGGRITVPNPSARSPGVYVNGVAVQVWNVGGSLPSGLRPNTVYYVINVGADRKFQLTRAAAGKYVIVPDMTGTSGGSVVAASDTPAGNTAALLRVRVGMLVIHPAVPSGTAVTSVTHDAVLQLWAIGLSAANTTDINDEAVGFMTSGAAINVNGGTGVNTIKPLGVFAQIRPFAWVPYAPLGLPNSFLEVS